MKKITVFIVVILFHSFGAAHSLENKKEEFGFYYGSKIYEERHPVDNSFFMSQEGWMLGINTSSEEYVDDSYLGFKGRLALGEVDYRSAGTGTMSGIPDYQIEGTGYFGFS